MIPIGLRRCVVLGGAGAVGSSLATALWRAGADVTVVDLATEPSARPARPAKPPADDATAGRTSAGPPAVDDVTAGQATTGTDTGDAPGAGENTAAGTPVAPPRWAYLSDDVTAPSAPLRKEISAADLVLLALPEPVICAVLASLSETMATDALLVDTSSVKSGVVAAAPVGRPMVSINPMFAPSLGMAGRPVAAVVLHGGDRAEDLLATLAAWGARVVTMTAAEHDRLVAASQAMTHAAVLGFGMALTRLDLPVATLAATAPPPHQTLLALLARVLSNSPEVYWDIQAANPYAQQARAALADGLRELAQLVADDDVDGFGQIFDAIRSLFGSDLGCHQQRAAEMFAGLTSLTER